MLDTKAALWPRSSGGDAELSFEEWSARKAKQDEPCKMISELRCKPFKDDDFCINCYRAETEQGA